MELHNCMQTVERGEEMKVIKKAVVNPMKTIIEVISNKADLKRVVNLLDACTCTGNCE